MVSKRMQNRRITKIIYFSASIIITLFSACAANANIATFEDMNLPDQSYWNGSDGAGSFSSDRISFSYNPQTAYCKLF